jgi:hypothetical protein
MTTFTAYQPTPRIMDPAELSNYQVGQWVQLNWCSTKSRIYRPSWNGIHYLFHDKPTTTTGQQFHVWVKKSIRLKLNGQVVRRFGHLAEAFHWIEGKLDDHATLFRRVEMGIDIPIPVDAEDLLFRNPMDL